MGARPRGRGDADRDAGVQRDAGAAARRRGAAREGEERKAVDDIARGWG